MFEYQAEKFQEARRSLMVPVASVEDAIYGAFERCDIGLHHLNVDDVQDDEIQKLIRDMKEFLDAKSYDEPNGGAWRRKIVEMSEEERINFSRIVDSLACWFSDNDARAFSS